MSKYRGLLAGELKIGKPRGKDHISFLHGATSIEAFECSHSAWCTATLLSRGEKEEVFFRETVWPSNYQQEHSEWMSLLLLPKENIWDAFFHVIENQVFQCMRRRDSQKVSS